MTSFKKSSRGNDSKNLHSRPEQYRNNTELGNEVQISIGSVQIISTVDSDSSKDLFGKCNLKKNRI